MPARKPAAAPAPSAPPRFSSLLPIAITLPFPGAYQAVTVVYDGARVQTWSEEYASYMADATAREATLNARRPEKRDIHDPAWVAWQTDWRAHERAVAARVIGHLVDHFTWTYDGPPPDPRQPESYAEWADAVLTWISATGVTQATRELTSFLFRTGSAATS